MEFIELINKALKLQLDACKAQKNYEVATARQKKKADRAADDACAAATAAWAAVTAYMG